MPGSGKTSRCEVVRSLLFLVHRRTVGRWAQGASHALLNLIRTPCGQPLASITRPYVRQQAELTFIAQHSRLNHSRATIFCFAVAPVITLCRSLAVLSLSPHPRGLLVSPSGRAAISPHQSLSIILQSQRISATCLKLDTKTKVLLFFVVQLFPQRIWIRKAVFASVTHKNTKSAK